MSKPRVIVCSAEKRRSTFPHPLPLFDEKLLCASLDEAGINRKHLWTIWRHIIQKGVRKVSDIPLLPHKAYEILERKFVLVTSKVVREETSSDKSTTKLLVRLQDGKEVECVIMRYGAVELTHFPKGSQKNTDSSSHLQRLRKKKKNKWNAAAAAAAAASEGEEKVEREGGGGGGGGGEQLGQEEMSKKENNRNCSNGCEKRRRNNDCHHTTPTSIPPPPPSSSFAHTPTSSSSSSSSSSVHHLYKSGTCFLPDDKLDDSEGDDFGSTSSVQDVNEYQGREEELTTRFPHGRPFRCSSRSTLCVSCQVGCRMGCTFCATGTMGLSANLTSGEILEQLFHAWERESIRNIVFMGMGEPLDNYGDVISAIKVMRDVRCFNLAAHRISISTVGVAPRIKQLARDAPGVSLALSLHAPSQELRKQLIPSSQSWPLSRILEATDYFVSKQKEESKSMQQKNRILLVEYILISDVNDSIETAEQLGLLLQSRRREVMVNIIPYNSTDTASQYSPPSKEAIASFIEVVRKCGVKANIRQELGSDIASACGQLVIESAAAKVCRMSTTTTVESCLPSSSSSSSFSPSTSSSASSSSTTTVMNNRISGSSYNSMCCWGSQGEEVEEESQMENLCYLTSKGEGGQMGVENGNEIRNTEEEEDDDEIDRKIPETIVVDLGAMSRNNSMADLENTEAAEEDDDMLWLLGGSSYSVVEGRSETEEFEMEDKNIKIMSKSLECFIMKCEMYKTQISRLLKREVDGWRRSWMNALPGLNRWNRWKGKNAIITTSIVVGIAMMSFRVMMAVKERR